MQTIGERLEEARKKKGISIREAAEATKIRGDYLSRFENNQFDINLTELYVRGFLRTYAQFLRLPVDRIINDYAALGRGEARPRQPSREIYGRMDVSITTAEERGEGSPAVPEEKAAIAQPARRNPTVPRRSGVESLGMDPALVFKIGKWAGAVVVAGLLLWGAIVLFSSATVDTPKSGGPISAAPTNGAQSAERLITLIALDRVQVEVTTVEDGRVLLPETILERGKTQTIPRPGPIYVRYSVGKNLMVEVKGTRYAMPTAGKDRIKVE